MDLGPSRCVELNLEHVFVHFAVRGGHRVPDPALKHHWAMLNIHVHIIN